MGFDVFLLDWGCPGMEDKELGLDGYIEEYLPRVVRAVLRTSKAKELFMLGYCVGAVQSLPPGVYIAMNGRVWDPARVRKNVAANRFEALD